MDDVGCLYSSSTFNFSHRSLYVGSQSAVQPPQMIVEHGIVVENLSGASTIQIKRTNASSSTAGASYAPLWKSQGSLKAATCHPPVNASYCALPRRSKSLHRCLSITAFTLHLTTCKIDATPSKWGLNSNNFNPIEIDEKLLQTRYHLVDPNEQNIPKPRLGMI